jgi:hypothetical protein
MTELSEIINKQAEGIARSLGMPKIKTTTVDEELKKKKVKKVFSTRVFVILDDVSGEDYAEFINEILTSNGEMEVIREDTNWTKDGELIRVVDYITYHE